MSQTTLQPWLDSRHKLLWEAFGAKSFNFEEAKNVLVEKNQNGVDKIPVYLSELRKAGWLTAELDPSDNRKRIYRLEPRHDLVDELDSQKKVTRSDLDSILKKAADLIRTRVDYKFILVLLFLKRISDKWEEEYKKAYQEALDDGLSEAEAEREAQQPAFHDFNLPQEAHWEYLRKDVDKLPENLSLAFKLIAENNPEIKDIFESLDFISFTSNRENSEILRQLVELFSAKKLINVSPDILGDAYEWILQYFAPSKAKEGEVYTPREVIQLLVEILDPKPGESVYDPTSASNGMLIVSHDHVKKEQGQEAVERLFLYGQEANPQTLVLGKMNLYLHNIKNHQLAGGDTLLYPKFTDGDNVKQFDVVIANPPWNQDGYAEEVIKKGDYWKKRFGYGFVPKQSADWAWIQHMLASAKPDTGRVGIVIDNGCLFRGGKEKAIRKEILEADLIESVILLPEKLFYNTGAPGAIIIFNRNKPEERKGQVLFINASEEYGKHRDVRKLNRLENNNIKQITKQYQDFSKVDGFSEVVSLKKIVENDYNLNVTLYAFPMEEIEEIDISKEWSDIATIKSEIDKIDHIIEGYLEELL